MKRLKPIIIISTISLIIIAIFFWHVNDNKSLLNKREGTDENKVNDFIKLADSLVTCKPDSSLYYYKVSISQLQKDEIGKDQLHLLSASYAGLAYTYSEMGDYDLALENDSIALEIAIQNDDKPIMAKAFLVKGLTSFRLGDYESSLDCYSKSMELAVEIKDSVIQAKICSNRAMVYFYQGEIQKSIDLFTTALGIGVQIKNETLVASNYMNLGTVYSNQAENTKASKNFEIALEKFKKVKDKNGELTCYQQLGNICYDLSEYAKAIEYYQLTVEMAQQMNDKSMIAKGYHNLAEVYSHLGDVATATDFYFKSIKIKEQINNKLSLARGYIGLGALYYNRSEYTNALTYFKKSLKLSVEVGSPQVTGSNFNNIANVFSDKHQSDSAIFYFNKALDVYQKIDYQWGISNILINLGSENCVRKNYSLSGKFLTQALQLKIELEDEEGRATVLHHLANLYLKEADGVNGDKKSRLFRKAEEAGLESYNIAKRIGTIPIMKDASGVLKEIYQKQEKYSEALQYSETFNSLNDSLLNVAKIEALTFAEARWNVEKKQQVIDNLENSQKLHQEIIQQKETETRQQRMIIWFIVALLVLALVSAVVIALYLRKRRDSLYQKQLANIAALRMQVARNTMSPHFFFNTLAAISGITNQPELLKEKLQSLSLLLRKTIENIDKTAVTLDEELDAVKAYIDLYRDKIPGSFRVEYIIEGENYHKRLIPSMILQIPVENAIKHGLMPLDGEKVLKINISDSEDFQRLVVEDNGIGLHASAGRSEGTGSGLKVLLQTIHLLNARNIQKIKFSMNEKTGSNVSGTLVNIDIPYDYNFAI